MKINPFEASIQTSSETLAKYVHTMDSMDQKEKVLKYIAVVDIVKDGGTLKVYNVVQIFFIRIGQALGLCRHISFDNEKIRGRLDSLRKVLNERMISPVIYQYEDVYPLIIEKAEDLMRTISLYTKGLRVEPKALRTLDRALKPVAFEDVYKEVPSTHSKRITIANPYSPSAEAKANIEARKESLKGAEKILAEFDDLNHDQYLVVENRDLKQYSKSQLLRTKWYQENLGWYLDVKFDNETLDQKLTGLINHLSSLYINQQLGRGDPVYLQAIETATDYMDSTVTGKEMAEMTKAKKKEVDYRRFQAYMKVTNAVKKITGGRSDFSQLTEIEGEKVRRLIEAHRSKDMKFFVPDDVG